MKNLFVYLQMVGNPDQQEDNVDEQYQEEGEEEVINGRALEKSQGIDSEALYSCTFPDC